MHLLSAYTSCTLCPKRCRVNRAHGVSGACHETAQMRVAKTMKHMWEEPPISGTRGSGAIFFSGCNLGCKYCQNAAISRGKAGDVWTKDELVSACMNFQEMGVHTINLVTATHFTPHVIEAVQEAKANGLVLPVVWNCSGYESVETIASLQEIVDVWLFDFKYADARLSAELSHCADYPEVALQALLEIACHLETTGGNRMSDDGILERGLIVRHLQLPSELTNTKRVLKQVKDTAGTSCIVSLMAQYTPNAWAREQREFLALKHGLTQKEAHAAICELKRLGFETYYTQDITASSSAFIPAF